MCSAKDRYTLIEQSSNTCIQYSQKNFMRIIGNDQKNNGQDFLEILERIIGKISSIIGAGLLNIYFLNFLGAFPQTPSKSIHTAMILECKLYTRLLIFVLNVTFCLVFMPQVKIKVPLP